MIANEVLKPKAEVEGLGYLIGLTTHVDPGRSGIGDQGKPYFTVVFLFVMGHFVDKRRDIHVREREGPISFVKEPCYLIPFIRRQSCFF